MLIEGLDRGTAFGDIKAQSSQIDDGPTVPEIDFRD
jgi:hypothetical protein